MTKATFSASLFVIGFPFVSANVSDFVEAKVGKLVGAEVGALVGELVGGGEVTFFLVGAGVNFAGNCVNISVFSSGGSIIKGSRIFGVELD